MGTTIFEKGVRVIRRMQNKEKQQVKGKSELREG
jgi:hypothetical protein